MSLLFTIRNTILNANRQNVSIFSGLLPPSLANFEQKRFAARKGKRIAANLENKKKAIKRKQLEALTGPKIKKFQRKDKVELLVKRFDDSHLQRLPPDDVHMKLGYKEISYSIEEAILNHRELNHPTMYDSPNALIEGRVELDMRLKKKTKLVPWFDGLLNYPHSFEIERDRKIVVVCRKLDEQEKAREAGSFLAGGLDIIKMIKDGDLLPGEFDHIVCNSDMILDLAAVRKQLKHHFPSKQRGNYGSDIEKLTKIFMKGIDYEISRENAEFGYSWVEVPFGNISMEIDQLKTNFTHLLKEVDKFKPIPGPGPFITRVLVKCPPLHEKFKIKHWELLDDYNDPNAEENEEEKVMKQ